MAKDEEWIGISIRFDPEEDTDLIDWAGSVPRGQRADEVKKALRLLITGQAVIDPNAAAFDRLRKTVESLARKIDQGVVVRTNEDGARTELDEAQAARRAEQIAKRKW